MIKRLLFFVLVVFFSSFISSEICAWKNEKNINRRMFVSNNRKGNSMRCFGRGRGSGWGQGRRAWCRRIDFCRRGKRDGSGPNSDCPLKKENEGQEDYAQNRRLKRDGSGPNKDGRGPRRTDLGPRDGCPKR